MRNLIETLKSSVASSTLARRGLVVLWQIVGTVVTFVLAFLIRFEGKIPADEWQVLWNTLPVLLAVYLVIFGAFRLYSGLWSYFSVDDLMRVGAALVVGTVFFAAIVLGTRVDGFPRSIFFLEFMLMGFWMTGSRFAIRYIKQWRGGDELREAGANRMLVVGKLADADLMIRAARLSGMQNIVAIVSDDPGEVGLSLHGVRIQGTIEDVAAVAAASRASCLLILPPFNWPGQMTQIVSACADRGVACTFRTIPSMADLAAGHMKASVIRDVDIEDLLGRGPARFDRTELRQYLKGKKVMITGAGGSIGAELCRQICSYEPAAMVLFEASEFSLYNIERELRSRSCNQTVHACAGDIRHREELEAAIDRAGGVDVIYHAAAYKHVPLMETNVAACFRTNVLGTARLAQVAVQRKVERFVMISSDKAVRPTSVMGVTKRLAERILEDMPRTTTSFVSVRFGNVLGSSGSVVPLFKEQIAQGGPVTVTTREVTRFFMTIPEATDLVLLAGTMGRDGDIMVLDMGQPIKIVDLARRMIELSGFVPDKDIKIEFTGLRPGEKGHEEVVTEDESVARTAHDRIRVLRKTGTTSGATRVDLGRVEALVMRNAAAELRALAKEYIPENLMG